MNQAFGLNDCECCGCTRRSFFDGEPPAQLQMIMSYAPRTLADKELRVGDTGGGRAPDPRGDYPYHPTQPGYFPGRMWTLSSMDLPCCTPSNVVLNYQGFGINPSPFDCNGTLDGAVVCWITYSGFFTPTTNSVRWTRTYNFLTSTWSDVPSTIFCTTGSPRSFLAMFLKTTTGRIYLFVTNVLGGESAKSNLLSLVASGYLSRSGSWTVDMSQPTWNWQDLPYVPSTTCSAAFSECFSNTGGTAQVIML